MIYYSKHVSKYLHGCCLLFSIKYACCTNCLSLSKYVYNTRVQYVHNIVPLRTFVVYTGVENGKSTVNVLTHVYARKLWTEGFFYVCIMFHTRALIKRCYTYRYTKLRIPTHACTTRILRITEYVDIRQYKINTCTYY